MRKMKESGIEWIGEIPEDWEVTILSALFKERKRKNIGLEETTLLSLSYGHIVEKNIDSNEGLLPASFETYNVIDAGCIVLRLTDLQNDKRSLRTGLCQERGIITSAYVTLERRQADNSPYMYYLFHTYDMCKVFYGMGDGVRQSMGYEELKRLYVLRPPFEQQKRIADYLDTKTVAIDDAIAKEQTLIDKLAAYKQSLITETVTKGLNPDAPMKDSGVEWIGAIPAHWTIKRLKYIVRISDGTHDTPQYVVPSDNSFPLVTSKCISDGCIDVSLANHIGKKDYDEINKRSKVEQFDVIMPMIGTVGNPALVNEVPRFAIKNVALLKTNASYIVGKYVQYLLNSDVFKKQIEYIVRGGVQNFISQDKLKNMQFPVCDDMKMIIDYLDTKCAAIDANIAKRRMMIEKLTQYKKSLIYEAVTGKMEI